MAMISEENGPALESLARQSQTITRRHFGRTMRLFAPLYVSNECVNNCKYCGFSRDAAILRTTLTVDQVVREAFGKGARLGFCQAANQFFGAFAGKWAFIYIRTGAVERQAQALQ